MDLLTHTLVRKTGDSGTVKGQAQQNIVTLESSVSEGAPDPGLRAYGELQKVKY